MLNHDSNANFAGNDDLQATSPWSQHISAPLSYHSNKTAFGHRCAESPGAHPDFQGCIILVDPTGFETFNRRPDCNWGDGQISQNQAFWPAGEVEQLTILVTDSRKKLQDFDGVEIVLKRNLQSMRGRLSG